MGDKVTPKYNIILHSMGNEVDTDCNSNTNGSNGGNGGRGEKVEAEGRRTWQRYYL